MNMENKKEIVYLKLEETDIDNVINFYNSIHHTYRNRKAFDWEFKKSPAGEAIYIIAKDVSLNLIVGCQSAIPFYMQKWNGEIFLTGKSEDTLVDPNYRGMNIFDNMYKLLIGECQKRGITYLWGFTAAKKPFIKLGFELPFSHSQSLLVYNTKQAYKHLSSLNKQNKMLDKAKIFGLVYISKIQNILMRLKAIKNDKIEYFIDNKFEKIKEDDLQSLENNENNSFYIIKNKAFLKWRIFENPYAKDTLSIFFKDNDEIISTISFSSNEMGVWFIINEMYLNKLNNKTKKSILLKAIKILQMNFNGDIDLIRNWEFTHNSHGIDLINVKKECGFIFIKRGIPFVWLPINGSNKINLSNINLSRIAAQGMT